MDLSQAKTIVERAVGEMGDGCRIDWETDAAGTLRGEDDLTLRIIAGLDGAAAVLCVEADEPVFLARFLEANPALLTDVVQACSGLASLAIEDDEGDDEELDGGHDWAGHAWGTHDERDLTLAGVKAKLPLRWLNADMLAQAIVDVGCARDRLLVLAYEVGIFCEEG